MKHINNISELKPGTQIVQFRGGQPVFWEYLCQHPKNPNYVLFLESLSQNAIKQYIPNLLNTIEWQIDYTMKEVLEYERSLCLKEAENLEKRINKLLKE